jgi:superfamily II DNA/RNA helicase
MDVCVCRRVFLNGKIMSPPLGWARIFGHAAAELHGGVAVEQRAQALEAYRGGRVRVLVATDLASRGLDLPVALVVQADFATDAVAYLHRAGRTARGDEATGRVLSFVRPGDAALATTIATAVRAGEHLAPVFSRKRSLNRARRKEQEAARAAAAAAAGAT